MDPCRNVRDELDRRECLHLLASKSVGRLVFTADALPAIRPVSYVVRGDDVIVVRTRAGTGVTPNQPGTVVAFQVDDLDAASRTGWSVSVVGQARTVDTADAACYPADYPPQWLPETDTLIELHADVIYGQRIHRRHRPG